MLTTFLLSLLSASPQVGDVVSDFTVKDSDGVELSLLKLVERGPVVVAFFPKAFSPGCTRELTAYRDRYADIQKHGATVVAVSADDVDSAKRFKERLAAPYHFVADTELKLIKAFDVKAPNANLAVRTTFVIGPGLKVLAKQEGGEAIDPSGAVKACNWKRLGTLDVVLDAGVPPQAHP